MHENLIRQVLSFREIGECSKDSKDKFKIKVMRVKVDLNI